MIENQTILIPLDSVKRTMERRTLSMEKIKELAQSIEKRGLIHTILIHKDTGELIAGEHRLEAFFLNRKLKVPCPHEGLQDWTHIPARLAFDVTNSEIEALMLEENLKRNELSWDDAAQSINRLHQLHLNLDPDWTLEKTGALVGLTPGYVSRFIVVAKELSKGNEKVEKANNITAAYNIISRAAERAMADEMNILSETLLEEEVPTEASAPISTPSILNCNFLEWLSSYSGPRFNLIHCDFPYGINHQKSDQGRAEVWGGYADSPDVYWSLLQSMLLHRDKIMYPSAHMVFWFSMNFYSQTLKLIADLAPELEVNPFPLIWHKSDNKGLLPDPSRGPRRIYETALLISRGDRKIVQATANLYSAPTTKELHLSEKPESMLRFFFKMLVDEHTELLDPTCGSGTALRAAESLGAKRVLGLELNPEFATNAQVALTQARHLRQLSKEATA